MEHSFVCLFEGVLWRLIAFYWLSVLLPIYLQGLRAKRWSPLRLHEAQSDFEEQREGRVRGHPDGWGARRVRIWRERCCARDVATETVAKGCFARLSGSTAEAGGSTPFLSKSAKSRLACLVCFHALLISPFFLKARARMTAILFAADGLNFAAQRGYLDSSSAFPPL